MYRRLEYTHEKLLEFKKQMDEKVGQGHSDEHGGGLGGFGGFGAGGTEVSGTTPEESYSARTHCSRELGSDQNVHRISEQKENTRSHR